MAITAQKTRVSIYLPSETHERLKACQESIAERTGLPFVSVSNVAALAIEHGLQRVAELNQAAANGRKYTELL
jgi:predicted DNA-binding protein